MACLPVSQRGVQETCRSCPAGSLTARITSACDEGRTVGMLQHSGSGSTEELVALHRSHRRSAPLTSMAASWHPGHIRRTSAGLHWVGTRPRALISEDPGKRQSADGPVLLLSQDAPARRHAAREPAQRAHQGRRDRRTAPPAQRAAPPGQASRVPTGRPYAPRGARRRAPSRARRPGGSPTRRGGPGWREPAAGRGQSPEAEPRQQHG